MRSPTLLLVIDCPVCSRTIDTLFPTAAEGVFHYFPVRWHGRCLCGEEVTVSGDLYTSGSGEAH